MYYLLVNFAVLDWALSELGEEPLCMVFGKRDKEDLTVSNRHRTVAFETAS
jgi:hypothetical protein